MAINFLQQVQTYQPSELAYFSNIGALVAESNKKLENFQNRTANLGSSVAISLPYRFSAMEGLVAVSQGITQRIHNLTVDQAAHVAMDMTGMEQIFNLNSEEYMTELGKSAVHTLGTEVEASVALNATSSVPVMVPDPANKSKYIPSGAYHVESGPCSFYGDGKTNINSYQQFAQMVANYAAMGMPTGNLKAFIPNDYVPSIIGTGLTQFVPARNEETANTWVIGDFGTPKVSYFISNLLPIHYAGSVGDGATDAVRTLTVVSTNDPTGANVTQINCTVDASLADDPNCIKMNDLAQFIPVANEPSLSPNALTYIGNKFTNQPVQFRIIENAGATGTSITIKVMTDNTGSISAPLGICTQQGLATQNMNMPILPGMKIRVVASHRAGLLVADNALYLSMPALPDQTPFPSTSERDKDTGVALRLTYGSRMGENVKLLVHDTIWASTAVPANTRRICFPLIAY